MPNENIFSIQSRIQCLERERQSEGRVAWPCIVESTNSVGTLRYKVREDINIVLLVAGLLPDNETMTQRDDEARGSCWKAGRCRKSSFLDCHTLGPSLYNVWRPYHWSKGLQDGVDYVCLLTFVSIDVFNKGRPRVSQAGSSSPFSAISSPQAPETELSMVTTLQAFAFSDRTTSGYVSQSFQERQR